MPRTQILDNPKKRNLYLEQEKWEQLDELAAETRTSMSEHVRRAVDAYLAKHTRKPRPQQPQAA